MPRFPFSRKLAALVMLTATLALALPPVVAAAPGRELDRGGPALSALFGRLHGWLAAVWEEAGCIIDPDGRCLPAAAAPPVPRSVWAEEGCIIDPDGRCRASAVAGPAGWRGTGRTGGRPPA